jgi:hypothetical protein
MEKNAILERFGGITKEEPLSTVMKNEVLASDTCLLESTAPFYAYYSEVPSAVKPSYLYLVLEGYYSFEWILQATLNIRKKCQEIFDASGGNITIFNNVWQVIRIRELSSFSALKTLQNLYRNEGIEFKKQMGVFSKEMGVIRLRKFYYLNPIGNGMYLDTLRKDMGYFEIPVYLNWNQFKLLTQEVKYETSLLFFDAGKAYILENGAMTYLVRVFRENLTIDRLKAIQARYLRLISNKVIMTE